MSITVRLWQKDLDRIGHDKWLTTVFMNCCTFSQEEIKRYPYHLRKEYQAHFIGEDEPVTIYAVDDDMAKRFLKEEYRIDNLECLLAVNRKTTIREVEVN